MSHQLVKRGSKSYECTVCGQHWTQPSKAHCPGLPVIAWSQRGTLMSQTELSQRGYRINTAPTPSACYRSQDYNHNTIYVWLYDSTQCERKRETKRLKIIQHVDTLQWPRIWMSALDRYNEFVDMATEQAQKVIAREPEFYRDEMFQSIVRDIAERASCLVFSPEIEDTIILKIPLTGIRRAYGEGWNRVLDMHKLVASLMRAYKEYMWHNRPPLTDEQKSAIAAKQEAYTQEQARLDAERRAALFDFPRTLVDHSGDTPVQRSLFA